MVPWVGLQFVIVVFSDHAHLRFDFFFLKIKKDVMMRL